MPLESLVRPFLLPDNAPPHRLETVSEQDAPIVRLMIGLGGTGKLMNGSYSFNESFYCTAYQVEKKQ